MLDLGAAIPAEWWTDAGLLIPYKKDAGQDADQPQPVVDAGQPDAAPSVDAAPPVDARPPVDATQPPDAAVVDASPPRDTGVPDAGPVTASLTVQGRFLVDGRGRQFVARGPELVTSALHQTSDIDQIAATGANALRMLLTLDDDNNMTPAAFDTLIGRAVGHRMVVWVSLFTWDNDVGACGTTRCIDPALGGGKLNSMGDYLTVWQRQWLKDLIRKYDGWVVIDGMQEFANSVTPRESPEAVREWVNASKQHVVFFRQQGYTQPLEIMTSFEGRDLGAIVNNADEILAVDTRRVNGQAQTLFGWQAYWAGDWWKGSQGWVLTGPGTSLHPATAMTQFVATRTYPIMVGLDQQANDTDPGEGYGILMQTASRNGIGWLWWAWSEAGQSYWSTVTGPGDGFGGSTKATH